MSRSARDSMKVLYSLANDQGGYFTAKQAKEAGYDYPHLEYHLGAGNFERVSHGLYRLPTIPQDAHDELIRLTLWSRNQKDVPQAVVSHETALVLHELTELLPDKIHLTVPPGFRKEPPKGCVIHKAMLEPSETQDRGGFRVTTPLRTLLDAAAGDVSQEQLAKAVADALSRGLVRRGKLEEAAKRDALGDRLLGSIQRVTRSRN